MMTKAFKEMEILPESSFPVDVFIADNKKERIAAAPHWHDCVEILYMLNGTAMQQVNDKCLYACKDDIIILNPGDIHSTECGENEDTNILVVKFLPQVINMNYINAFESKYIITFLNNKHDKIYHINGAMKNSKDIFNLMMGIYKEYLEKEIGYEIFLKGYIYQLIAYLLRSGFLTDPYQFITKEKDLKELDPLLKYIETHYREDINLLKASKMLNLSYCYLSKYFKKATGRNFKEYIDFTRICEAEKFILSQNMNITQAAYEVGFSSVSAFCRAFKRVRHYTPGTIKRSKTVYK